MTSMYRPMYGASPKPAAGGLKRPAPTSVIQPPRRPRAQSAYQPGQAQPKQQQPQGTPYGRYMAGTSAEYKAANPDSGPRAGQAFGQQPASGSAPRGDQPQPFSMPQGGAGNFAYAQPDQRPAPFTTKVRGFDGQQYDPGQFIQQRDAFISTINQARQPFAMDPSQGQQPMDFGGMWSQSGDMVANGWQNPLTGLFNNQQAPSGRLLATPGSRPTPPPLPDGQGWMY